MTSLAFDIRAASGQPDHCGRRRTVSVLDVLRHPVLDVLNLDTTPATTCGNDPRAADTRPVGRFRLVTPCISACHRGSMRGSGYGHIADSVRAERPVRITARFPIRARFVPLPRCRTFAYPGRPVLRRPGQARRRAGLVRTRGRDGLPDRPAPSHRGSTGGTGCALPPLRWTTSTAPAEPVMYPPYTCAGDAPDHEAAMPACGRCEQGARSADVDLAKESGAFHRRRFPRYRLGQDHCHREPRQLDRCARRLRVCCSEVLFLESTSFFS
jgi:hypothetical protein